MFLFYKYSKTKQTVIIQATRFEPFPRKYQHRRAVGGDVHLDVQRGAPAETRPLRPRGLHRPEADCGPTARGGVQFRVEGDNRSENTSRQKRHMGKRVFFAE